MLILQVSQMLLLVVTTGSPFYYTIRIRKKFSSYSAPTRE